MKSFLYFFYLYLVVYVPVISGSIRKFNILLYLFIALIIIFRHKKISYNIFRECRPIWFSIVYLTFYVVLNVLFNNADSIILTATFSMTIVPFFSVLALSTLFILQKRKDFIKDFIKVATMASVISVILYLIPQLGKSILFLMSGDDADSVQRFYDEGRGFGVAGSLFFGYSIIQAIAAFLCMKYNNKIKGYFYTLLILISIILNARIGLFVFIALLLVNYLALSSIKQTIKMIFAISIVICIVIWTGLYHEFQGSIDWTLEGVYMVSDFLLGTNYTNGYGHFSGLAGSFLIWPNNTMEWIFGRGIYLLQGYKGFSSDVGFILQLNWGGLIYLFFLLLPLLIIVKNSIKTKNWTFIIIVLTVLIICDWKGDLFTQSNFLFIIITLFLLTNRRNEINICNYRSF